MNKKYFVIIFSCLFFLFSESFSQTQQIVNGKYKLRNEKGKVIEKGHYKNYLKIGIWYFFDENGMLIKEEKFVAGKSKWQLFFEKGKVTKIIDKNGKIIERSKCGC